MPKKKMAASEGAGDGTCRFVVLAGVHVEADGEVYAKGDVVETEAPLDEMFANKFKRLDGETQDPRNYDQTFDKDDVMDELLHEKDKPGGTGEDAEDADTADHEGEETEHGVDVSAKFKDAAAADLVVFQTEAGFNVADKDNPGKPLNKKPLPYNKVKAFIKTQLGG